MGTCFLLLDDARKVYFECDKFHLPEEARVEQSFESFWRSANGGHDEPAPETSNRYQLAESEAKRLYEFCVASDWKVRLVADCWDDPPPDYGDALRTYEVVSSIEQDVPRAACATCGLVRLLTYGPRCAQCVWRT